MGIAQEIIDKVQQAADIIEIIGEYVSLKKKGANYWGSCPFHNEKTGSFCVSPSKQIFKCFGCGKGGNVFAFLQKQEGISFPEAIRLVGKKYNIDIPDREMTTEERLREHRRESLQVAMRSASLYYEKNISDSRSLDYLRSRGFLPGPGSILERYQIGYSQPGNKLLDALTKQGFSDDILVATSLISIGDNGRFDYLRNRIIFPFINLTGNITGFTGRDIDGKATTCKYLNSKDTDLFKKGSAIFGLYQAKKEISKKDKVYWVEGQFDVLTFANAGITNTVCGSGTAMTDDQIKLLLRFTNNVTLIYDGDNAGLNASRKNIALLVNRGAAVRCVRLPAGEDPDSFARKMDPKDLEKYLSKQEKDFATFMAKSDEKSLIDPEQREKSLQEISDLIAIFKKETLQASYVRSIAGIYDIDPELIWRKVRAAGKKLPSEEEIPSGFYGMDESIEMLREEGNVVCQLVSNFELFSKYYGVDPAVYFKGIPSKDQIQNFRRLIDCIEFSESYLLAFDDLRESDQLLLLKELFKSGVTINVISTDAASVGFAQYYVSMYSRILIEATDTQRAVYIDRCAELISFSSETVRTVMASDWSQSLGLKTGQYKEILKPYIEKRKSKSAINIQRQDMDDLLMAYDPESTPSYVDENEDYNRLYRRYGFYPQLNKSGEPVCYMFKNANGSGHIQVADFYMIPLLHIYDQDSEYNKRVIQINRLYSNQPLYIEIKSKCLVKLSSFEEILLNEEALNFENGDDKQFRKIRQAMSYNYIKCSELKIFGQQSENFYAFSNAIFHEVEGEFRVDYANDLGVMSHDEKNYYTPAYSKIYSGLRKDSDRYEQHRYFIYKDIPEGKRCTFGEWTSLMDEVYKINDNGKWAVIYAIMCAFRSDIHIIDRLFTALFFVGPTMSGKTQIAISIRSLYVDPQAPSFNLNSGTDAAFFTLMEGFRDVPQVLEEYNNKDISKDKFQGLKAITYDGDGKQKRKGVSDREIDTSKVNSPIIILGQETPEKDDNALTNRVVLCEVPKRNEEYTKREMEVFQKLKDYEKCGLCNVLFEILKLRPLVRSHFKELERKVNKELTDAVLSGSEASGDMVRIIKTVSLFLSMCKLLEIYAPDLKLPFTYKDFFQIAKNKVKWQIELISHTDKLAGFFKAIEVMINTNTIKENRDYSISQPGRLTLKTGGNDTKQIMMPTADTKVLFIRLSILFSLYSKSSYNAENATLSTIEQNIRSNPSYIGVVNSRKFIWQEVNEVPRSALNDSTFSTEMVKVMEKREQVSSCIALNYDVFRKYFDIDLERSNSSESDTTVSGELKEVRLPDLDSTDHPLF